MLLLQLYALLPCEIKEVRVVRKTDIYKNWTTARLRYLNQAGEPDAHEPTKASDTQK